MKWSELASKIGFHALEKGDGIMLTHPEISIWNWGTGRDPEILGGVRASYDGGQMMVADFEYEHSRQMHAPSAIGLRRGLTFVLLDCVDMKLPHIYMRNEAPINKLYKRALGKHDINFVYDPAFSERFEVQGPEEDIHRLFRPEVRSYFLRYFENSSLRLETHGNSLLLHFGVMLRPEDCRVLMESSIEIANFWSSKPLAFEVPFEYLFK